MSAQSLDVPRTFRRGGKLDDVATSVETTLQIVEQICRKFGIPDLSQSHVLDMGCGWRMAKTLLDHDIPIAEYAGIDVFSEMIEFLRDNVSDPRFSFHRLDSHNEMYNPEGKPLAGITGLPVPEATFDIICLFSVFTHLAPHDYVSMLKLLRPYVKPEGRIIYSLFVYEATDGGHGFIDKISRNMNYTEEQIRNWPGPPDFKDWDPSQPLKWAIYSRENALKLVEGTGWEVESLNDPEDYIQHHMICRPV